MAAADETDLRRNLLHKKPAAAARTTDRDAAAAAGDAARAFRAAVKSTLMKWRFYIPSFKVYGGVAGLYDLGPYGTRIKANVLDLWYEHFVFEEDMLEVDCSCLTPKVVLKASGHVDKFTDLMVKDEKKMGSFYRADHLIKDFCKEKIEEKIEKDLTLPADKVAELKHVLAVLDDLSAEELGVKIKEYGILSPDKNPLSESYAFNLLFETSIGPSAEISGYLRPETAQGIFVNFNDLYALNDEKLPFAAAQVGQAFRNKISPRQGLLRACEFTMAEIEHFVDPDDKSHPKYRNVADLQFLMFPRNEQLSGKPASKMCLSDAVDKGIVNNQTLGYFMGRVYLFLTSLGIDKERLRFRQHLANEMAHYAVDCWDAEIECSYGWIECVGIADRLAYDLKAHTDKSGVELVAHEKFSEPREVEKLSITPSKKDLGLAFKGNHKNVVQALEAMKESEAMELKDALESKGEAEFYVRTLQKSVTLTKKMVSVAKEKKIEYERSYTPSVIEPSFGIAPIIYCLYEHTFYTRPSKDGLKNLNVFRFPPLIAPKKCAIFPLVQREEYEITAKRISKSLNALRILHQIDIKGTSIGKKYAQVDELGVPFAITIDSLNSVTIRERDSKEQVRVDCDIVAPVIKELVDGHSTWESLKSRS